MRDRTGQVLGVPRPGVQERRGRAAGDPGRLREDGRARRAGVRSLPHLRQYKNPVQTSNVEGARLGITGTPTFFINGRILVGAQPFEAFAKIIDEELALGRPGR